MNAPSPRTPTGTPSRSPATGRRATLLQGDSLLAVAFLVSLAIHALALSIGFTMDLGPRPREPDRGLEVVLVNARHARAPQKAEVLAQANLDGGGTSEQDARPKSPLPPQPSKREGDALVEAKKRTAERSAAHSEVMTAPKSAVPTQAAVQQPDPAAVQPRPTGLDLLDSVAAAARLEAEIDRKLQEYAKRPRKTPITAARAKEYRFAQYVEDWRQKIERVGTLNYPDAARGRLYGSLLLYVAIKADGSVERVEIQRSSGEKVLDEAALRIVKLAGPFAPFPDSIRADTDIVEIVRTWTFTNADRLTAQ
ncbi:TonB family protein [Aromatoleum toluvorans]|uniref:TonB family protein n=2 Tax=Aromatoleum toluvorans TaxID=92002 RepID=A0ABX1Q2U4_9RHOO|nr:TonB family protein [Aromatoleum toluvorans]NMG45730.1 TonB family protein [Aromatoleum toluvorans]